MFGKIKRIFFTGIFGILYVSFVAQLVWVLCFMGTYGWDLIYLKMFGLAVLSLEWLVLIAARYLSKRSSAGAQFNGHNRRR